MLADAPVDVAAAIRICRERRFRRRGARVVGAGEVGGAADHFGHQFGRNLEGCTGPFARGVRFLRLDDLLLVCVERRREPFRNCAGKRCVEGIAFVAGGQALLPCLAMAGALCADPAPRIQNFIRNDERLVRPVDCLADARDLFRPVWAAMGRAGAGDPGRAKADDGLAGDQRGAVGILGGQKRAAHRIHVVAVDARDIPARCLEALHLVGRI